MNNLRLPDQNLPSGTVTFLFTDIEGSTKLAQEYPDEMSSLLARHNQILHQAIERHNGYVFRVVGDSFAAAFHFASDALGAAVDAQRLLFSESWTPALIKVRMGIHTGAAQLQIDSNDNAYSGYATLASTQRIMSAGHGGQVLLSGATHELVRDSLPANTELVDLGEKRLKDLLRLEHLYQLNIAGLPTNFPPLKTLDVSLTNLPTRLSTFIGREKEIEQIKIRLEKNRLVTLTGSGGVGKTRLSIQVASQLLSEYLNGVWLVELAPINDPTLVPQTVCAALDVTPQGNTPALNALNDYLKHKKILLIIDNCEHLVDASAQLCETLLHACPNLQIIASSREALGIDGENAYRVPSLSLPNPHDRLQNIEKSEAVKLFMERATAALPEFKITEANATAIAQICQRLDGIALAIELAASRVKLLKVEQIASRLDDVFRLLTGGSRTALPRQQTLRALIDWSYNLLTDEERTVLQSLSVFVDGWTLEAAESVCDNLDMLDVLTHLVDKSLVAVDLEHGDEPRYYLLETIRQYAREKLNDSGEGEQVRARHLDYFLTLAQKAEPKLYGANQIEWLQKLENEHENMHAALGWSLQADLTKGQHLAGALWWSWDLSGHPSEGYDWLRKMLMANPKEETLIRAKLLAGAGWLAGLVGYPKQKEEFAKKSVALYQKLGDRVEIAVPLITLGSIATNHSDYESANQLLTQSLDLFKQAGNKWGTGFVLSVLAFPAEDQKNFEQAQKFYDESLLIFREIGDKDGIAWILYKMGELAKSQGNNTRAMELLEEALQIEKEVRSKPVTSWILSSIGTIMLQQGNYERSRSSFEEALKINRKTGSKRDLAYVLANLGWHARLQGDYSKAYSHFYEGLELIKQSSDDESVAEYLIDIGVLLGVQGYLEKFARILGSAEGLFPNIVKTNIPFSRTETEQYIKTAFVALGNEAYTAAYEAGKQMSLDEAVAFALKELGQ